MCHNEIMPGRGFPLLTGDIFHIVNRGITDFDAFADHQEYQRAIATLAYYRDQKPRIRFSFFVKLPIERQQAYVQSRGPTHPKLVSILAFCLMLNHFHLLLKQLADNGISTFLSQFTNSYTRYFNTKNKRSGPIFQGRFKAVRIESEEQLMHVSRYIHLNPYSAGLTPSLHDLETYPYSSFTEYLEPGKSGLCETRTVSGLFGGQEDYKSFVFDHADYQRQLEYIKHLTLDP